MALIEIDTNPPRRRLNEFGLIWLVFFAGVGGLVWYRTHLTYVAITIWGAAVVVPAIGWTKPTFMRAFFVGMCYATYPIGLVVSFAIMATIFYLIITPIGLAMRLFGYDPMCRRLEPDAKTYWTPHKPADKLERYFEQF